MKDWWISHSFRLPEDKLNGWVVAMAMEEYAHEAKYADACHKAAFATRMQEAGLGALVGWRRSAAQVQCACRCGSGEGTPPSRIESEADAPSCQ